MPHHARITASSRIGTSPTHLNERPAETPLDDARLHAGIAASRLPPGVGISRFVAFIPAYRGSAVSSVRPLVLSVVPSSASGHLAPPVTLGRGLPPVTLGRGLPCGLSSSASSFERFRAPRFRRSLSGGAFRPLGRLLGARQLQRGPRRALRASRATARARPRAPAPRPARCRAARGGGRGPRTRTRPAPGEPRRGLSPRVACLGKWGLALGRGPGAARGLSGACRIPPRRA
jgi:hypothetical protein